MKRISSSTGYEKVQSNSEKFVALDAFKAFKCQKFTSGVITVILTDSGKRVKVDKSILETLGNLEAVSTLFSDDAIAICASSVDCVGSFQIRKGGIIYSTELADKIIAMNPDVVFAPNTSTRCGSVLQAQENDDITAVIVTF